jgi:inositol phosphorylceramide synthase catalytic subunit
MNSRGLFHLIARQGYELIHGLTPANYSMKGSPGGLVRIDALLSSQTYTIAFSNAPVVFGAFPSLHSACATFEAIFISHFFPSLKIWAWAYAVILYWSTMYLTHHYLVDVVGGACLAAAMFYLFIPEEFNKIQSTEKIKQESFDLERVNGHLGNSDSELSSEGESRQDIFVRPARIVNDLTSSTVTTKAGRNERGHKHTASIASLVGPESQVEHIRSPIGTSGFHAKPDGNFNRISTAQ